VNLRNTQRIYSVTEPLYSGPLIQCFGPEGKKPVQFDTNTAEISEHGAKIVIELVKDHGVAPADVAVLSGDNTRLPNFKSRLTGYGMKTTDALTRGPESVVVDTIANFKGLESLVVILLADRMAANNQELSYVAVSRARTLLIVIGSVAGTMLGNALSASDTPIPDKN